MTTTNDDLLAAIGRVHGRVGETNERLGKLETIVDERTGNMATVTGVALAMSEHITDCPGSRYKSITPPAGHGRWNGETAKIVKILALAAFAATLAGIAPEIFAVLVRVFGGS